MIVRVEVDVRPTDGGTADAAEIRDAVRRAVVDGLDRFDVAVAEAPTETWGARKVVAE